RAAAARARDGNRLGGRHRRSAPRSTALCRVSDVLGAASPLRHGRERSRQSRPIATLASRQVTCSFQSAVRRLGPGAAWSSSRKRMRDVKQNIGDADRVLRNLAGAALAMAFAAMPGGTPRDIIGVAAVIFLLSCLTGWSLLYFVLRVSTRSAKDAKPL